MVIKKDEMKETTKILSRLARDSGKDFRDIFSDMLEFLIDTFEMENLRAHRFDMTSTIKDAEQKNAGLFSCLKEWIVAVDEELSKGRCLDFFGAVYEDEVKSAYKAAKMGQFFTPTSLCNVCADIVADEDTRTVNDPACGSGRLLLSAFQKMRKDRLTYFVGEDLDGISVKMCALNMMMNGMFGHVVCRDTLTHEFHFALAVNETMWPFPSGIPSIRRLDERQCNKLEAWYPCVMHSMEDRAAVDAHPAGSVQLNLFGQL